MNVLYVATFSLLAFIHVCASQTTEEAPRSVEDARPKLIVFDLDSTLWPFWLDTHVVPPFHKSDGDVFDQKGKRVVPYPEVLAVMDWLHSEGYLMATASRTWKQRDARQLIALFGWEKYLKFMEIYPGSKMAHFNEIKKQSNIPLSEMLFFDDEEQNIRELTQLGVVSVLVLESTGITMQVIREGLAEFAWKRREAEDEI